MNVEVKLFASFKVKMPPDAQGTSCMIKAEDKATVEQIFRQLELPEKTPKIILVNGKHATSDHILQEGDTVSLFPPLSGG